MQFTVYGDPVAKGRPKFSRQGGFVRSYTPAKTTNYENLVKLSYLEACGGEPYVLKREVSMRIDAFFPIPKSTSKKKSSQMQTGEIRHTKRPDIDNLCKSILDGLNKIAFLDDSQIVQLIANKYYSIKPRVEITIKEMDHETQ